MAKEQEVERKKKILDEQSDLAAAKQIFSTETLLPYTVQDSQTFNNNNGTARERLPSWKEKSAAAVNENPIFLTLAVSEGQSGCFGTPHSHYLTEGSMELPTLQQLPPFH